MKAKTSGIIYIAVLAALICSFCDKIHVITNTLYYPQPVFDGQPWWTFPGFFVAFVTMCIVYLQLVKHLPAQIDKTFSTSSGNVQKLTESLLLFAFVYLLSGFGNEYPLYLNVLFYSTFLIRLAVTSDKQFILIVSLILGISGTLGEGLLSEFGLVYYTKPVVFHMPLWLAGVYMHGAFALRACMRFFVYRLQPAN
ncbi:MAG: hypothetical protein R2753_11505 [Chitinophagales bacterium]